MIEDRYSYIEEQIQWAFNSVYRILSYKSEIIRLMLRLDIYKKQSKRPWEDIIYEINITSEQFINFFDDCAKGDWSDGYVVKKNREVITKIESWLLDQKENEHLFLLSKKIDLN